MELMEQMEIAGLSDHKDLKVYKDLKELKEHKEHKEKMGKLELKDHLVHRALLDHNVLKVQLVKLVHREKTVIWQLNILDIFLMILIQMERILELAL